MEAELPAALHPAEEILVPPEAKLRIQAALEEDLHAAGGHTRNPLLMELYADATALPVIEPATDAVLLGTAMTAAAGAGLHPSLTAAATAMHQDGTARAPNPDAARRYERDERARQALQSCRVALLRLQNGPGPA